MCPNCGKPYGKRRRCYYCNGRPRSGETKTCPTCGSEFYAARWQLDDTDRNSGTYCSRDCKHEAQRGRPNKRRAAIGTKRVRSDGYVEIKTEHGQGHWPLEHRHVIEHELGRPLETEEHVHHVNGDKADNRPENLAVYLNAEHQSVHDWTTRSKRVSLTCERCGTEYTRKPSKVAESRFCSASCRARRSRAADRRKAK